MCSCVLIVDCAGVGRTKVVKSGIVVLLYWPGPTARGLSDRCHAQMISSTLSFFGCLGISRFACLDKDSPDLQ
jgi:hypothetical protein